MIRLDSDKFRASTRPAAIAAPDRDTTPNRPLEPRVGADTLQAHLNSLTAGIPLSERVEPQYRRHAEYQARQAHIARSRIDGVLSRLLAREGVPPYHPADPSGAHRCFRHRDATLEIRPYAVFLANDRRGPGVLPDETGFKLYLHGSGMMAKWDGAWVENPDDAFFSALDEASRPAASFVL